MIARLSPSRAAMRIATISTCLRFESGVQVSCGRLPDTGRDQMSFHGFSKLENAPSFSALVIAWGHDRSVLRQLRARAPTHRATNRRSPRCGPRRPAAGASSTPITAKYCFQLSISNRRCHGQFRCFACGRAFGRPARSGAGLAARHRPHPKPLAARIAVRGETVRPKSMDLLEDQGCGFILGLPGNVSEIGQPWSEDAAVRRVQSRKDKVRRFFQIMTTGIGS